VTTYKSLCDHLGAGSPRSVGNALRENPFSPFVPCHRVVTSSGFVGGFRGAWTAAPALADPVRWNWQESVKVQGAAAVQGEKVRMLALEGVGFSADGRAVDGGCVWGFRDGDGDEDEEA
jgi:methylated-DNA-[protein]-cysteine S-methyltransferase